MRVLRRGGPGGCPGLRPARPSRVDGRAGAEGGARVRTGEARARRHARHERPASERRPPERRLADLACALRGRATRVRREPRASRGRRRRCAGVDWGFPRGVPGGRHHPARQARRCRPHRRRRVPPRAGADPVDRRDGGGLPRADRCERNGNAPPPVARRPPRARDGARRDGRAARVHRATDEGGARGASARRLRGRRVGRHRRLHGRAGAAARPGRDRARRGAVRHDGLRPAAARTRELDLRADVLGLRVRAQVPRRSRLARQRRLLPPPGRARAAGHGDELHLAGPRGRRLGDADASRRCSLPRAAARVPEAAPGGDEGDDVPGGLRRARPRGGRVRLLLRDVRRRLRWPVRKRRAGCRPDARPEHGERAGRGDRAQLPGPGRAARARPGQRRAGPHARRARPAEGLPLRPLHDVHDPRRPRPVGAVGSRGRA